MAIEYDHALNMHSLEGPREVFTRLVPGYVPTSILDVGCGTGTWLRAALDTGVEEAVGIDGVDIPPEKLLIPRDCFLVRDFTRSVDLGRRFDVALCLEVAEHIDREYAATLVRTLTRHSDLIVFSAAVPGQDGQHHVNCEPPCEWQRRFNDEGYVCDDEIRWRLWLEEKLEPWYRQNIFIARRNEALAAKEPRIKMVIHPDMLPHFLPAVTIRKIEHGSMPANWYLQTPAKALAVKAMRKCFGYRRAYDSRA